MIALLMVIVEASQIYRQTSWKFTECIGAPHMMLTFPDSNLTSTVKLRKQDADLRFCGRLGLGFAPLHTDSCCHSSTLLRATIDQSFAFDVLDDSLSGELRFHKFANGNDYCHFKANDRDSLHGWIDAYYLRSSSMRC
jgi:hypothetical protein